jgi:two-component system nitrate/nitrite sensor histidine kinase NarX
LGADDREPNRAGRRIGRIRSAAVLATRRNTLNPLRQMWAQSILLRVGATLGLITAIALAVIVLASFAGEYSAGKAGAINVAGSLRMQSYALATRVASLPAAGDGAAVQREIDGFEARLRNPVLLAAIAPAPADPLRQAYERIVADWRDGVQPRAREAIADPGRRPAFIAEIDRFVADVDRFVGLLERDAEARIQWLRLWLAVAVLMLLALMVTTVFLLYVEVFDPLSELLRSARAVRTGSFKARVGTVGPDEMGQLGQAFNLMVEQLGKLYGSLEKQVAEKTSDLERKNRSLALLYETTRGLSERPLDTATLATVLESLKRVLGVEGGVICAHRGGARRGFPLVRDGSMPTDLCAPDRCADCDGHGKLAWRLESTERGERRVVSVPLIDGGTSYGAMPLALAPGKGLEPWQIELAETIGRHIGAALAATERREEHQRLALLEERSAIARELHDSLAQSLSYTKIQLMRLATLIEGRSGRPEAQQVLTELREGVASAYRQLRELLTTFRLKAGGDGLAAALRETVAEFERHSRVPVAVEDELIGIELSANEQIHVLQIVREALTNVEKHARARHVTLKLQREEGRAICVTIDDDGVGIDLCGSPRHHFGLAIMRDRAALLGGRIEIGPREGGGTRVQLRFVAATAFAASAAEEPARSSVEAN